MFDRLYKRPRVVARHWNGPLVEERCRYLVYGAEQEMAPLTLQNVARYTLVVAKALRLADRPGETITKKEIVAAAERWAKRRPKHPMMRSFHHSRRNFTLQAIRWLGFLGRMESSAVVRRPYAEHVAQFSDYQLRDRGLSPQTVEYCGKVLHQFLSQIEEAGLRLQTLNAAQMDDLLSKRFREAEYARNTIQRWAGVLRTFFRFAEQRGWCKRGLAAAIMVPRIFRHAGLPVGVSWDDVKRLLATTERGRPVDIRDHAILMLLAVYGLRVGEVTALRLKDFDWEREILSVPRGKSQRPRTYPLCRSVGDAVLRYLREVRRQSTRREVFLTVLAPFRPLTSDGMAEVVRRRLHGLGLTLPHYGPHVLRHACATHLLAQGLSLKEIGDHLGHRTSDATSVYAKVDLAALRTVADFSLEGLL
ncbi:MAG: integrase [Planctomycetes bacterium]|nr:integrase [Planctomycetota bacterium]